MPAVQNPTPLLLGRAASALRGRPARGGGATASAPGPGNRFSDWLRALPRRVHLIPYGALLSARCRVALARSPPPRTGV